MAIRKNGENLTFPIDEGILTPKVALGDKKIAARFMKLAKKIKRIAPKAKDFLYGHAIMMHAAEACLIDQNTGEPVLHDGKPITATFEPYKLANGKETVKWVCSKEGLMPYKNANGDIFPEAELVKAHKEWIGKPLCKDHKSESVDGIRGIVIDTYYDPKFKRVHALFALDRKNYGDLARKVETGYANCVSMGTAVGRSVCTECGNVAVTEREYCRCIRGRSNFGEINLDLKPIELSLVVNGADGLAKIRNIVAHLNGYAQKKQARLDEMTAARCVNPAELQDMADVLSDMQKKLAALMNFEKVAEVDEGEARILAQLTSTYKELKESGAHEAAEAVMARIKEIATEVPSEGTETPEEEPIEKETEVTQTPLRPGGGGPSWSGAGEPVERAPGPEGIRMASTEGDTQGAFSNELRLLRSKIDKMQNSLQALNNKVSKEENNMNSARLRARAKARRAYWLGGGGVNEPTPGKPKYEKEEADKIRDTEDKHMVGTVEMGSDGLYPGDEAKKKEVNRDGLNLGKAALKERAMKRRAYWLGGGGVNEPSPGKYPYDKDPMAEKVRDNEDKHLQGIYDMGGKDGTVPGDMETKKKLLRAKLRAKFTKVADDQGNLRKDASRWDVFAGDKLILSATGSEIYDDRLEANWDYLSSREYGKDVIKYIREEGLERVAYLLKGAAPPAGGEAMPPVDPAGGEAMPPMEGGGEAAPAPEAPAEEPKKEEDDGVKGKVDAALTKMESAIEDIRTAVTEGGDKLVDIEVKVDEDGKEGGGAEATPVGEVTASREKALEVHALMNDAADELALISEALEQEGIDERVVTAAAQALEDSEAILDEAALIIVEAKGGPKCKKCGGKLVFGKCMGKCKEDEDKKKDDKDEKKDKKDGDEKKEDKKDEKKDDEKKSKAEKMLEDALRLRAENRANMVKSALEVTQEYAPTGDPELEGEGTMAPADDMLDDPLMADDMEIDDAAIDEMLAEDEDLACDHAADKECPECASDDGEVSADYADDAEDFILESDASVKEARRKAREELVAQATDKILGKYELDLGPAQNATMKEYFDAHPGGKGTTTELSHTKTDEAKVETISEIHDVMRDVAESGPRNVREAAMAIQEGFIKGAFKTVEELDQLVAEGKVDSAAASYWKKYWSHGPDTGSFGADLSKEFASKKKEASDQGYKVKLRRAYDLGLVAQEKGMIGSTRSALETYVDEVMQFDDAAFESTKRIVAGMNGSKKSGSLPRVGADAASEAINVTASVEATPEPNLASQLSGLGWK